MKPGSSLSLERNYNDFSVSFAERRDVGDEWNLIEWNKKHLEIDCHRLYYRTDENGGKATLHLIDRTIELTAGKLYFIPAFTILQSKIDGHMNKYYIHFRSNSPELRLHRFLSDQYSIDSSEITEHLFKTVIENYTKNTMEAKMKVEGAMQLLLSDFFKDTSSAHKDLSRFESILSYIEENKHILKGRTKVLTHGDYHLGNMIFNDNKGIGIIDFNKLKEEDPYDDFKPFVWSVRQNKYFESGLINGYFDNNVPSMFFKLLKLYSAEALISHIPWAYTFGKKEIEIGYEIYDLIMKWYDNFKLEIPTWYIIKEELKKEE
jgi:hypothetical protein